MSNATDLELFQDWKACSIESHYGTAERGHRFPARAKSGNAHSERAVREHTWRHRLEELLTVVVR